MCIFAPDKRECSSVGRASASQAEGRGFEPRYSLKIMGLRYAQPHILSCHWCATFRAELASDLGATLRAFLRTVVGGDWSSALRAELTRGLGAALRASFGYFGCWGGLATVGAELARDGRAALRARNALWLLDLRSWTRTWHRLTSALSGVRVVVALLSLVVEGVLHNATAHAGGAHVHHA